MTRKSEAMLTPDHLSRTAIVYIRQSSGFQVRNNVERRRLQYELVSHARGLGFSRVEVIDDDLGVPSNGIHREGYERLLTAVCNKSVGLVLAIEASRLARGGSDWHMLLEFCAIVGCLGGDRERLYDPAVADDRAYLGVLCRIRHSNPYVVQVFMSGSDRNHLAARNFSRNCPT